MRVKSILQLGFSIAVFSIPVFSFAENARPQSVAPEFIIEANKVYVPEPKDTLALQSHLKDFDFDWGNYTTIASNKNKMTDLELFIKQYTDPTKLDKAAQELLGNLLYKMGTFYAHVTEEPDFAIAKMDMADKLLTVKNDKIWNEDHLAYAYEQKYALTREASARESALEYSNKVITELGDTKSKEVAFAYMVKGLIQNDEMDYAGAKVDFGKALTMYDALPNDKDDQYAQMKNRYAMSLLQQNSKNPEALALLEQLNTYWQTKADADHNLYAAKTLLSLSQAYLDNDNAKAAKESLLKVVYIYENVYGPNNNKLVTPYLLLAATYKKLNEQKLAMVYQEKAQALLNPQKFIEHPRNTNNPQKRAT